MFHLSLGEIVVLTAVVHGWYMSKELSVVHKRFDDVLAQLNKLRDKIDPESDDDLY